MENLLHRSESEIAQQPHQSPFRCLEIEVVRGCNALRQVNARMPRINFSGVKIKDGGPAETVDAAEAMPRDRVRKNAEIRAAGAGDVLPEEAPRRDGKFLQGVAVGLQFVRPARRVLDTVAIVGDGED